MLQRAQGSGSRPVCSSVKVPSAFKLRIRAQVRAVRAGGQGSVHGAGQGSGTSSLGLHALKPGSLRAQHSGRAQHLLQALPSSSTQPLASNASVVDPVSRSKARNERFGSILELRALYREFIRAKALLRLQSPIYVPLSIESDSEAEQTEGAAEAAAKERELEEQERRKEAVEIVAEMQLTAESIKLGLRALPPGFGSIFASSSTPASEHEGLIRRRAREYMGRLRERVTEEIVLLPFPTLSAAQAAIDARNARFTKGLAQYSESGSGSPGPASPTGSSQAAAREQGLSLPGSQEAAQQLASSIEKLGQAEKVAEQFVATRIKPVLRKAREGELVDMVKETGVYLRGLWVRLNGGGSRLREPPLSPDLPMPANTKKDIELAISELSIELDGIEAKLKESAKAREAKLRKMRAPESRATMPFQLKIMDEEVLRLSRALAVRLLQMEMEYVYSSLEDEALDITNSDVDDVLRRQGSTAELRLLAAEFAYLDEQLSALAAQLHAGQAGGSAGGHDSPGSATGTTAFHTGSGASGGATFTAPGTSPAPPATATAAASTSGLPNVVKVNGVPVSVEELLVALGSEVPDMRQRVGVPDQLVFGGQGFTFTKARLQVRDALDKVREAVTFMSRGIKLLGSDISSAARLFGRAAVGGTLKPREVSALRRTARDLLTFIPFTIILIIPLTPLGHVLVFGFIQTYFPSLYPSCFTSKRQEMMIRYEELERQLYEARNQAEQVEEEAELMRAATAKATRGAASNSGPSRSSTPEVAGANGTGGRVGPGDQARGSGSGGAGGGNGTLTAEADSWPDLVSLNEAASVAVAARTAQVRALEERIAAVLDDVTLGDEPPASDSVTGSTSSKRKGARKVQ